MRTSKQLLLDSRQYAHEIRWKSWWALLSTLALFIGLEAVAVSHTLLPIRILASVLTGLVMVRLFILYHDYEHGTILRRSRFAWVVMKVYGLFTLNPPSIWKRSHDHHHKHNSKMGATVGSFGVMTIAEYDAATPRQRLLYSVGRHPLTLALGYLTVFLYGMCTCSLIANPKLHKDSAVAIVAHVILVGFLIWLGIDVLLLALIVPAIISAALGSYLFYAQHNYPAMQVKPAGEWDYVTAALHSSSYTEMGPVMHWLTGNIGYHHVHHLNHHIPFYRLPEAMAGLEELQSPGKTSLRLRDVVACLRLKLWDERLGKLVPWPRAADRPTPLGLPVDDPAAQRAA